MIVNFGITIDMIKIVRNRITPTASAIIQVISGAVAMACPIARTQVSGARKAIDRHITIADWTWLISFVVRVMSEAVENLSISAILKLKTCLKKSLRTSREKAVPIRADKKLAVKAQIDEKTARPIIKIPVRQT